jgi:hypothetical protein
MLPNIWVSNGLDKQTITIFWQSRLRNVPFYEKCNLLLRGSREFPFSGKLLHESLEIGVCKDSSLRQITNRLPRRKRRNIRFVKLR